MEVTESDIITFVRNADQPVYILDVIDTFVPLETLSGAANWSVNVIRHNQRDNVRSLVWGMIDRDGMRPARLRLANDLTLHVTERSGSDG